MNGVTSDRVIFLHAVGQSSEAADWMDVPGMVSLTLPGHGRRRRQRPGLRLWDIADEISGWAQEPLHVVGTSIGGMVAMHLALDHPQLVQSLVLMTTLPFAPDEVAEDRASRVETVGAAGMVDETMERWFTTPTLAQEPVSAPVAYAARQLAATSTGATADIWRAMKGHDVRERLGSLSMPVTCLAATHDVSTPAPAMAIMADAIPNARWVEVDAAHAAHLEAPDAVSSVIRQHLDRHR